MKKLFSKLGSLLLAAALLTGLVPAALADSTGVAVQAIDARTITVNEVAEGDTVKAYRLVTYTDASYNSFSYYEDFGKYLDNFRGDYTRDAYFATLNTDTIANLLGAYATYALVNTAGYSLPTAPSEIVSATADADEKATLTLQPGYYLLLVETTPDNSKIYKTMSVFMRVKGDDVRVYAGGTDVTGDPQMTAKHAAAPAINKQVKDTTGVGAAWKSSAAANVGDELEYYVHLEIPAYTGVHNIALTLNDTLTGAKYVEGSAVVCTSVNSVDTEVDQAIADTTVGAYNDAAGTQELTFQLNYGKLVSAAAGTVDVYVTYKATLMPQAVSADKRVNPGEADDSTVFNYAENSATLTYATDLEPNNFKTTAPSTTRVYTFSLALSKTDSENDPLTGAGFTFYRSEADLTSNETAGIKFVKDGDYYRPATAEEIAAGAGVITEVPADFLIKGLTVGTYYLEETTVPGGYYAPKGGFKVDLNGTRAADSTITGALEASSGMTQLNDGDRLLLGGSAVSATNVNQLNVTLKNSTTPLLPTTGGMGTALFTIGGVALMAAAAAIVILRRKRGE